MTFNIWSPLAAMRTSSKTEAFLFILSITIRYDSKSSLDKIKFREST